MRRLCLSLTLTGLVMHCGLNDSEKNRSNIAQQPLSLDVAQNAQANAEQDDICATGLSAFENSVFPLIRDRCVNCHERNDRPGPKFAVANSTSSYAAVLRYQNFDAIADSFFVTKGGNMHCQSSYGQNCHTEKPEMIAAIESWWTGGENACPRKGRVFSESLRLPTLPDRSSGFQKLRLALASQANPGMRDVFFEMEAQLFQPSSDAFKGAYRFRKPRLLTPWNSVYLKDIKILVNGSFDPQENAFRSVEQTIAPKQIPSDPAVASGFPDLSSSHLLTQQHTPGADEIMVSFEALSVATTPPACRALNLFSQNVLPFLNSNNCYNCHGGGSPSLSGNQDARSVLDMALSDESLCASLRQRLSGANLFNSPLITYPFEGTFGHEVSTTSRAEVAAAFSGWFGAEQL